VIFFIFIFAELAQKPILNWRFQIRNPLTIKDLGRRRGRGRKSLVFNNLRHGALAGGVPTKMPPPRK